MKKLLPNQKQLLVGGAAKGGKRSSFKKGGDKQEASRLTKWNNYFHNAGLVSVSSVASIGHLISSFQELLNKTQGYEEERKYKPYKTALRPSFRFSNTYWNSSVTFGMPWYY